MRLKTVKKLPYFIFILLLFGCATQKPQISEDMPKQVISPVQQSSTETTQQAPSQMVEEYALMHQMSDMKVAEYYLTHPDYAEANPYMPTNEDMVFYESKFLEKVYPNFRKDVEKEGFAKARKKYMNNDPNTGFDVGIDARINVQETKTVSKEVESELEEATQLYNKGLIDEAIEHIKLAINLRPDSITAYYDLGVMYMKKEAYREAMGCFQKTIELLGETGYTKINMLAHPKVYMGACINLGMIYNYLNLYDEATIVLSKAIEFQPKDFDANWNLAITYYNMKDPIKAALQLKKCIEIDPENAEIHNLVGIVYYNMQEYTTALDEFRTASKLNPHDNQYGYNEGLALSRLERYESAIQAFERASEMQEANDMYRILSEQTKLNEAKEFYNKGCTAMDSMRIDEAIENFNSALEVKPDMAEVYVNLAYCYRLKHDPQKQVYCLEEAAKLNPYIQNLYYNLGLAYNDAGMYLNARYALEKAIDDNPSFKDAHFNLAMTYYKFNRIEDSAKEFDKCLELSPDWFEAHINLGNCYLKIGNIEEAINQYREATELKPNSAEASYDLGIALTKAGRYDEAKGLFQKAIKLDPSHKQARDMLKEIVNYQSSDIK